MAPRSAPRMMPRRILSIAWRSPMPTITILATKELTLSYHEEAKIVHHELHRYPGASTLEAALERGLSVLREHGAQKWLSDDRNGGALPKAHHEWAETDWG